MRVALVYRAFHLSGSLPRFHVELARYLSGRGHDVHVYSTAVNTERSLAPACTFHNVPVEAIARGSGMSRRELRSFARAAAALLERADYDIVHTRAPSTWVADVLHVPGVQRGEAELEGRGVVRLRLSRLRHPGTRPGSRSSVVHCATHESCSFTPMRPSCAIISSASTASTPRRSASCLQASTRRSSVPATGTLRGS